MCLTKMWCLSEESGREKEKTYDEKRISGGSGCGDRRIRRQPRAIIVHSLVETHYDHMMSAAAAIKATQLAGIRPEIYFQEQDIQSRGFQPVYWVDVSALTERRRELISLWACQGGPAIAG